VVIAYALSALLSVFLMFGLPVLAVYGWLWNRRRLARARRYRAVHGTPWWLPEHRHTPGQSWQCDSDNVTEPICLYRHSR